MYPVFAKSIRNLRPPASSSCNTFCFNSCRLPTMSCPSTSITVTSSTRVTTKFICPPMTGVVLPNNPHRSKFDAAPASRLQCGDARHVYDVVRRGAARQVVARAGKALEDRADRRRSTEPLHQLVADVARVQIGRASCRKEWRARWWQEHTKK